MREKVFKVIKKKLNFICNLIKLQMDKLPVELKMKVFNELVESQEIKISVMLFLDSNSNLYEDYSIKKMMSPFGKETVVCKKTTKEGNKDDGNWSYKNEKVKILNIKDIYKFIEMKILSLYQSAKNEDIMQFIINLNEEEVEICGFELCLVDEEWKQRTLKIVKLYLECMW